MPHELKGRLLIVDNDPDAGQTLHALLSHEGYETRRAPDGQRTLAFAEADPPELILLNVRLPDIDGYEVCRRLMKSEKTRFIPVIFLCGLDDVEGRMRGFEAGGVDYLTKPFQAGEVLARVKTHLSLQHLRKQLEARNRSRDAKVQKRKKELLGNTESPGWLSSEREKIGEALEERLRFERLLSDVSARFVNISPEQVEGEIENALRTVLEFFQVDRCALIRTLPGKTSWQITHVAVADDQVPPVPLGAVLSRAINPWAYEMLIEKQQVLAISSLDDVPPEGHVDRQTWIEWGIRSNLNIPIYLGESVDYVIAINALKRERVWPAEVIPRLRLLGEIFVHAMERRNAEQALRESEERLDLATAAAEAGIWIMSVDTGLVWVTDKLRELFRFAPDEELTFERFLEVIHPDDREHVRDRVWQSLEKREPLIVDYRILLPDGSIRWIAARGRPYSRASGLPERLMGVSSDVTQRKIMELQLSESRTLLSSLVDSTSDMIWSVDSEHFGLLTFNRGLYEYFLNQRGIHIEAGMRPEDLFPTDEFVQKWRMFYRKALEEGSFTTEYLVFAGTRTLRLNLNRLKRDDIVFGVSVFGQDITERKQADEAIRESEAKYRRLYESMMDGYVLADLDGIIQTFNDSFRVMTGYSPDELRRMTYRDITPEKWHPIEQGIIEQQVLIRGYSEIYEKEYRKKDGTVFPVELRTFLLKDEQGTNLGSWAIARDITNRKLIESEARKLREELAHVTRVSTLGELTSALAHEINQPLAAILSNAQAAQRLLSQDKPDTQEVAEILGDIIRDDNRAAEVIRKIRSLLKNEEIRYESLSLTNIIEEILSVICNDTVLAAVSVVKEFEPALPTIWGDRIQLQQVILNLILNAAEAMKEERPDVRRLVIRTSKQDSDFAKVSISDAGPGIEQNNLSRLFKPFYTTKAEGMGMGLAISKEIIKAHKGVIWAENNPDKGAVFFFTVPFDRGVRP